MGDLITTHSHDLIFQPTETLAARVILEQERREEFERANAELQKRWQRSKLWSFSFGGAAFASAIAATCVWFLANSQIAKAEGARDLAVEENKAAIERENDAWAAVDASETVTANQADELHNLVEYKNIAYLYDDLENEHLYTLDRYRALLTARGNRLPLEIEEALDYDANLKDWVGEIQQQLRQDERQLVDKIDVIESYIETLELEIERPQCYPNKVFGSAAERCK